MKTSVRTAFVSDPKHFALLSPEQRELFSDGGQEPDGNILLPREPISALELDAETCERLPFVDIRYFPHDQRAELCDFLRIAETEDEQEIRRAVERKCARWCYFPSDGLVIAE